MAAHKAATFFVVVFTDFEAVVTATDSLPSWAIASGGVAGAAIHGGMMPVPLTITFVE